MAKKIDKNKLKSLIGQEIANSFGFYSGELSKHRKDALRYYLGQPMGNETEGSSAVVSQDLQEIVDSIMPSLMRVFTQGESIVNFQPTGPEDVEYAEQASDYINHIFLKDNPGYNILFTLFKDALISKNGFVKYYWKTSKEQKKENYKNLTEIEYQSLLIDDEINVINVQEDNEGEEIYYDVQVKRVKEYGKIAIENVPPENILVSKTATSLDDCNFIAQRCYKTRGELIDMGFKRDEIEDLPAADEDVYNTEAQERRSYDDETTNFNFSNIDPSQTTVVVTECYLKVDMDGDGIGELRKIVVGGNGSSNIKILSNEEIDIIPFAMCICNPMPHRFFGLSMYDQIADLQAIKTTVLRQMLDNMYRLNNSRLIVQDSMANLDDVMVSRPGGIIRVKSPDAIKPLVTPNFIPDAMTMIAKLDEIREARSGISKSTMGLNADQINKSHTTASSANIMMNASTQRLELFARNFSEGIKRMFQGLLQLTCTHQEKERIIRLRGKFITMNPREWNDRYNATVQVGLGTGSQDQRLDVLTKVLNVQEKIMSKGGMGIVKPQNIYNTLAKYLENAGYADATKFFNNPENTPPAQPKQKQNDPAMVLAQQELQMKQAKDQADIKFKQQKLQSDNKFKEEELELKQEKLANEIIRKKNNEQYANEKLASEILRGK